MAAREQTLTICLRRTDSRTLSLSNARIWSSSTITPTPPAHNRPPPSSLLPLPAPPPSVPPSLRLSFRPSPSLAPSYLSFLRLLPRGSFCMLTRQTAPSALSLTQQSLRVSLVQKSRHVRRLVSRGCACVYTNDARRKGVESYGRQAGGAILEDDLSSMEHPIGEETRPSREGQEVLDDAVHDDSPLGRLDHVVLLGRGRVSRLLLARLLRQNRFDIPPLELETLEDRLHVCLPDVHSDVSREANLLCIRRCLPLLSFLR